MGLGSGSDAIYAWRRVIYMIMTWFRGRNILIVYDFVKPHKTKTLRYLLVSRGKINKPLLMFLF